MHNYITTAERDDERELERTATLTETAPQAGLPCIPPISEMKHGGWVSQCQHRRLPDCTQNRIKFGWIRVPHYIVLPIFRLPFPRRQCDPQRERGLGVGGECHGIHGTPRLLSFVLARSPPLLLLCATVAFPHDLHVTVRAPDPPAFLSPGKQHRGGKQGMRTINRGSGDGGKCRNQPLGSDGCCNW